VATALNLTPSIKNTKATAGHERIRTETPKSKMVSQELWERIAVLNFWRLWLLVWLLDWSGDQNIPRTMPRLIWEAHYLQLPIHLSSFVGLDNHDQQPLLLASHGSGYFPCEGDSRDGEDGRIE
jgi:hypothetical protein